MEQFYPEGILSTTAENARYLQSPATLAQAAIDGRILEARAVLCDAGHNLHVALPCMEGIIPYEEGAVGIADGTTRDIALISRVGKPVCFVVSGFEELDDGRRIAVLSRRAAQQRCRNEYIHRLRPGDILQARVTRCEVFGAFCDIGCGLAALLPIAGISVSRIRHPSDRLRPGMDIRAVLSSRDGDRVCLSQRELLGTWEENARRFSQGETVEGIVRSVENYGVFIELAPNLTGLSEAQEGLRPGQRAAVYIKSIIPERMKLKLVIIDVQEGDDTPPPLEYFIQSGHIDRWVYSPVGANKRIESVF